MERQENRGNTPDTSGAAREENYKTMREGDPIDERLLDEGERSPQSIEAAAEEGFIEDQREDPEHPSRIQREQRSGIEDPSHSQGI